MLVPKGFIKDANGNYIRGNYIIKEGQITRIKETKDLEDTPINKDYELSNAIQEVLKRNFTDKARENDVYINKTKDGYKQSDTKSKDTVAIVTTDNNVYTLQGPTVTDIDDKSLEPSKDEAKAPEQQSDKVKDVEVKDVNDVIPLKESDINLSKFIYDLDKDKGNAWSASGVMKDGYGNKLIIVSRNGFSDNTAEDIKREVEKKYPNLKGEITENKNRVWFYLGEPQFKFHESEQLNVDSFTKLIKQINDLELEQIKTAKSIEDLNKARELRNLNFDAIVKSVDLSAPTDEEKKAIEDLDTQEEPIEDEPIKEGSEEQVDKDITVDKPKLEQSTAKFIRRPKDLQDLKEKLDSNLTTNSSYTIVDTIELSEQEFDKFASNLRQDTEFLKNFRPDPADTTYTCLAVKGPETTLLVDNSGYDSAHYVSIL